MHAVYFSFFKGSEDDYGNSAKRGPRPTGSLLGMLDMQEFMFGCPYLNGSFFCLRH